jgi:hypothetical protein
MNMADALFPVFGTTVAPMLGRRAIMDRLWRELTKQTPSHLQVVGPRYAGKTVLLHALAERMRQPDSPFRCVILWDLGHLTPGSNADFLLALAERIGDGLRKAGSAYADELRNLSVDNVDGTLKEVLEVLKDEDFSILLLMDGFDKPLAGGRLSRNLWDQLRELGSLPNLRFVTASRQPLSRLIRSEESATSDFWNIFDQNPVRVGPFEDEDIEAILARSALRFDTGARSELDNWSGRFPPLLLMLVNEVQAHCVTGGVEAQHVNEAATAAARQLEAIIENLWRDCPVEAKDLFGGLRDQGPAARTALVSADLDWLLERGFAKTAGGKVACSCRLLNRTLGQAVPDAGGMARLFGTVANYQSNMRGVLERRLAHLTRIDDRLRRLVELAIKDIPDHAEDCLNNLTHIQERALDLILRRELGDERILRHELLDTWHWCDSSNPLLDGLKKYAGRKVPSDRLVQRNLLQLLTGSQQKIERQAIFATKDMYALVSAIHTFRNRSQHGDGESMDVGVAVAALMLCLELLACIDRGMAES